MSIRTIAIVSFLILATVLGRLQDFSPPTWAWVMWGILLAAAIAAWFIVSRAVSLIIQKVIMLMPLPKKFEVSRNGGDSFPVADLVKATELVEDQLRASFRFPPLQWLAVRAFRSQTEFFLKGILDHCKEQGSDVVDTRLIATYIKSAAAGKLGEFAGDLVSGGCQIAVIVLVALGLVFGMPSVAGFWSTQN